MVSASGRSAISQ